LHGQYRRHLGIAGLAGCAVLIGVSTGCAIGAEVDFIDARADAECGRLEKCSRGYFESEYPSHEDCVSELKKTLEDASDAYDDADCKYVPEEGGRCVRRIRGMSCEAFAQGDEARACDLVYDCEGIAYYTDYNYYGYY
jgi:hypothetical protein